MQQKQKPIEQNQSNKDIRNHSNSISKKEHQLQLENIIGLSCINKHSITFNNQNSDLIYPAGSIVISYNVQQNIQTRYDFSPNKRAITCLCFSPDNKYLVTGEGICKNPEILFWNQQSHAKVPEQIFKGHKFGIKQLIFSPNNKYLVSIGDENDRGLFVWDPYLEQKLTMNKLSKNVNSSCFSPDGTKFLTVGNNHFKIWNFSESGDVIRVQAKEKEDAYIMEGKNANLGSKFQNQEFTDAVFSTDGKYIFMITLSGLLGVLNDQKVLEKWMDLKVQQAFSIQISNDHVFCGCSDGYIRVFKQSTLEHVTTLPRPPSLNNYSVEKGASKIKPAQPGDKYADCIGLAFDGVSKLCTLYSDKTIFIWELNQLQLEKAPYVKRIFLNHSDSINDLQLLQCPSSTEVSFLATVSNDKTIRVWHLIDENIGDKGDSLGIRKNVYAPKYLSKIIYQSQSVDHFKYNFQSQTIQNKAYINCVKCSGDGQYLATGDIEGNLRIYSMNQFDLILEIAAHDQEISCLDFTPQNNLDLNFLVTGSRDRLIHIYSVKQGCKIIGTLEEHSGSIIAIKFVFNQKKKTLHLISCAADKTIIIREYFPQTSLEPNLTLHGKKMFQTIHKEVDKHQKFLSCDISQDQEFAYFAQEKKITVYHISSGKLTKTIETKEMDPISGKQVTIDINFIVLDSSGSYMAVSGQDKIVRVREVSSGNIVARANVGDTITGITFSYNNKLLITATNEGCIMIWKIPLEIKNNIEKKKHQLGQITKRLKELFRDQEMLMSKEWTINSFWIEDELKKGLENQKIDELQDLNFLDKLESQDMDDENKLDKDKLFKSNNLPQWAKTSKPNELAQINQNQILQSKINQDNQIEQSKNDQDISSNLNQQNNQNSPENQQLNDKSQESNLIFKEFDFQKSYTNDLQTPPYLTQFQENKQKSPQNLQSKETIDQQNQESKEFQVLKSTFTQINNQQSNISDDEDNTNQKENDLFNKYKTQFNDQLEEQEQKQKERQSISSDYKNKKKQIENEPEIEQQEDVQELDIQKQQKINLDDDQELSEDFFDDENINKESLFDISKIQQQLEIVNRNLNHVESFKQQQTDDQLNKDFEISHYSKMSLLTYSKDSNMIKNQNDTLFQQSKLVTSQNQTIKQINEEINIQDIKIQDDLKQSKIDTKTQFQKKSEEDEVDQKLLFFDQDEEQDEYDFEEMLKKGNTLLQSNNLKIPAFETNQKDSGLFIDVRKEMNKQKINYSPEDPVKYQQQEILLSSLLNQKEQIQKEKDVVVLQNDDYYQSKQEHEFEPKTQDSSQRLQLNEILQQKNENSDSLFRRFSSFNQYNEDVILLNLPTEEDAAQVDEDINEKIINPEILNNQQNAIVPPPQSTIKIKISPQSKQQQKKDETPHKSPRDNFAVSQFEDTYQDTELKKVQYEQKLIASFDLIIKEMNKIENIMSQVENDKDPSIKQSIVQNINQKFIQTKNQISQLEQSGFEIFQTPKTPQDQSDFKVNQVSKTQQNMINVNDISTYSMYSQQQTPYGKEQKQSANNSTVANQSILNQTVQELVIGSSRDLLENYSKQLLELLKQNLQKQK